MSSAVKGIDRVSSELRRKLSAIQRAVMWGWYVEGLSVIRQAVMRAPVDTGRLRASHFVEPPQDGGGLIKLGFATEYAQRQNYEHRTAKGYLTDTLILTKIGRATRIAKTASRLLRNNKDGHGAATSEPGSANAAMAAGLLRSRKRRAKASAKQSKAQQKRLGALARRAQKRITKRLTKKERAIARGDAREARGLTRRPRRKRPKK